MTKNQIILFFALPLTLLLIGAALVGTRAIVVNSGTGALVGTDTNFFVNNSNALNASVASVSTNGLASIEYANQIGTAATNGQKGSVLASNQTALITAAQTQGNNAGVEATNIRVFVNYATTELSNMVLTAQDDIGFLNQDFLDLFNSINVVGVAATNGQKGSVLATNLSQTLNGAGTTATNAYNLVTNIHGTNIYWDPATLVTNIACEKVPYRTNGGLVYYFIGFTNAP